MRTFLTLIAASAILAAAPLMAEQPEVKPGPEHAMFKDYEGTWDATIKSMGGESKGTMVWKVGLNGLWLLDHFESKFGDMRFEGHGGTSYDPTKKKYTGVWIDSMSTSPMVMEGTYNKKTKTMTMFGQMPMPDGKSVKATFTTVSKDANTKVFTITAPGTDGKTGEMLHITYKRREK